MDPTGCSDGLSVASNTRVTFVVWFPKKRNRWRDVSGVVSSRKSDDCGFIIA